MRARLLATLGVLVTLVGSEAAAQAPVTTDTTPRTCDARSVPEHVRSARKAIERAFEPRAAAHLRGNWRQDKLCLLRKHDRLRIAKFVDQERAELKAHQQKAKLRAKIRAVTPYGKWAIPPAIVYCESQGSWDAYNPSGALGPYQLLGKGAPFPVDSLHDKYVHHRIAYELYAGGAGRSHWVC